jgi:hypothetical protein
LTVHWLLSAAAILIAAGALSRARRVSKRLERLTESYWELRYEHGQLRSRLAKLEPGGEDADGVHAHRQDPGATQSFVPLSSLKR